MGGVGRDANERGCKRATETRGTVWVRAGGSQVASKETAKQGRPCAQQTQNPTTGGVGVGACVDAACHSPMSQRPATSVFFCHGLATAGLSVCSRTYMQQATSERQWTGRTHRVAMPPCGLGPVDHMTMDRFPLTVRKKKKRQNKKGTRTFYAAPPLASSPRPPGAQRHTSDARQ